MIKIDKLLVIRHIVLCFLLLLSIKTMAQEDTVGCFMGVDSVTAENKVYEDSILLSESNIKNIEYNKMIKASPYHFKPLQLLIPTTLISVGIVGLKSDWLIYQNHEIRDELQENIYGRMTVDNYTQYVPMVASYGLNLFGIKGKHGYADLTIILGTAYAIMGITVNTLKNCTRIERPDASTRNSFPSGHTATAFMGAELLRREYWDVSPWIGISGYAIAIGTGFFRMYNNRHWLTDVLAGAGVGILSVEAAYWLYPAISKTFFHKRYLSNAFISPYLSGKEKGVTCSIRF